MELKQIKELMASMGRSGVKKLSLKKEGFELQLERGEGGYRGLDHLPESHEDYPLRSDLEVKKAVLPLPTHTAMASQVKKVSQEEGVDAEDAAFCYITSPMVGTFYTTPSPDDPPFVKPGDRIDKNSVVCIVEAMKVMNEIKAGVVGVVDVVLIENNHPIEFGTKLFRVRTTV